MRETREDEAPSGDQLEGVREAGREAELDVLHQHLLKDLRRRKREINGPALRVEQLHSCRARARGVRK